MPKITGLFGTHPTITQEETFETPDFLETIISEDKARAAKLLGVHANTMTRLLKDLERSAADRESGDAGED